MARILAVDEDSTALRFIECVLGGKHRVTTLSRGRDATSLISGGERFDVILCGVTLPDMDGMKLRRGVSYIDPEQLRRVVFMTAAGTLGGVRFIRKPLKIAELLAVADSYLPIRLAPRVSGVLPKAQWAGAVSSVG